MRTRRPALFRKRQFEPIIILTCVRWYCRFSLSLRDLKELMAERGLAVDHTTIWRWVQRYGPEIHRRLRGNLKTKSPTWHMDETFVRIAGRWLYLFRAVDGHGQTVDFFLSETRDREAAKRFSKKALANPDNRPPRVFAGSAQLSSNDPRTARRGPDASMLSASHAALCRHFYFAWKWGWRFPGNAGTDRKRFRGRRLATSTAMACPTSSRERISFSAPEPFC